MRTFRARLQTRTLLSRVQGGGGTESRGGCAGGQALPEYRHLPVLGSSIKGGTGAIGHYLASTSAKRGVGSLRVSRRRFTIPFNRATAAQPARLAHAPLTSVRPVDRFLTAYPPTGGGKARLLEGVQCGTCKRRRQSKVPPACCEIRKGGPAADLR